MAFGGGHGLAASLSALRRVVDDLTAVVTVADNGGSSGRLRGEYDVLPPGDLRMALSALCGDDEWGSTWARLMQHRFPGEGPMGGHAVGNLLMVGLWDLMGDRVLGLEWVARLLGVEGRVLPMSLEPLDITARVRGEHPGAPEAVTTVRGQEQVALTPGEVVSIALHPDDPPACPQAVESVGAADWLVLGPGSWYSSVIPHLLVPDLRSALVEADARRLVVMNLTPQSGETDGYSAADHLCALLDHAPDLRLDVVLADPSSVGRDRGLDAMVERLGAELVVRDVRHDDGAAAHDPVKLARAFTEILGGS
ncbi:uridine diphosphate-N-acetylglucosamine-binding protein YvcK [Nocardioidaceae bacterium]|nr:uridine diphosphate-N-acetylglucosamine-binding protein YvcK [Nocardioidaceae bacterium]